MLDQYLTAIMPTLVRNQIQTISGLTPLQAKHACFVALHVCMLCMPNRIVLSAKCALHYNPGPCREFSVLWHFDPIEGRCKDFLYGGCGGNENRFLTREDCKRECATEPGRWRICCARLVLGEERPFLKYFQFVWFLISSSGCPAIIVFLFFSSFFCSVLVFLVFFKSPSSS